MGHLSRGAAHPSGKSPGKAARPDARAQQEQPEEAKLDWILPSERSDRSAGKAEEDDEEFEEIAPMEAEADVSISQSDAAADSPESKPEPSAVAASGELDRIIICFDAPLSKRQFRGLPGRFACLGWQTLENNVSPANLTSAWK